MWRRLATSSLTALAIIATAIACSSTGSVAPSTALGCDTTVGKLCAEPNECSSLADLRARAQTFSLACCSGDVICGVAIDRCGEYIAARSYATDGYRTFYFDLYENLVAVVEGGFIHSGSYVCRAGPPSFTPPPCGALDPCVRLPDAAALADVATE